MTGLGLAVDLLTLTLLAFAAWFDLAILNSYFGLWCFLAVGLAAVFVLPGTAQALDPITAANRAWPGSPCVNHLTIRWDPTIAQQELYGFTRTHTNPDGTLSPVSCEITLEPAAWARMSPAKRCELMVHEAGHLAGHQHTEGGVMTYGLEDAYWAPCEPVRARVVHDVGSRLPKTAEVYCSILRRGIMRCQGEWRQQGRDRVARFRVRLVGERYTIRPVRVHS